MTPPLGDGLWNPLVAVANVPEVGRVLDARSGTETDVALSDVLLEFSPLELTIWADVPTGIDRVFARGAYLARRNDELALWLIDEVVPSGQVTIHGPFRFRASGSALQLTVDDQRLPLSAAPGPSKTLLVTLMVLTDVGSRPVASPVAASVIDDDVAIIPLLGGGHLVAGDVSGTGTSVYLPRDSHDQPSTVGLLLDRRTRSIAVHRGKPWAAVKPDDLAGPPARATEG